MFCFDGIVPHWDKEEEPVEQEEEPAVATVGGGGEIRSCFLLEVFVCGSEKSDFGVLHGRSTTLGTGDFLLRERERATEATEASHGGGGVKRVATRGIGVVEHCRLGFRHRSFAVVPGGGGVEGKGEQDGDPWYR
mmetsp:Transcript_14613/g.33797  ORF Transcript_14613/g.33797 Transcript_14613/m.33797 type:complete len:135 (+) Transcript_14613:724-1128(+)